MTSLVTMALVVVQSSLQGKVSVDGSSTVYPITEAVAEEIAEKHPKIRVTVGISGTGGGFKRFAANEIDISDASRTIKRKELDICQKAGISFIEIPVAYDGLTVVVNPKNDWAKDLTVNELKTIFLAGGANKWSDVRPEWPNERIRIYSPGTDSGLSLIHI